MALRLLNLHVMWCRGFNWDWILSCLLDDASLEHAVLSCLEKWGFFLLGPFWPIYSLEHMERHVFSLSQEESGQSTPEMLWGQISVWQVQTSGKSLRWHANTSNRSASIDTAICGNMSPALPWYNVLNPGYSNAIGSSQTQRKWFVPTSALKVERKEIPVHL